jgi:hypothetical protein
MWALVGGALGAPVTIVVDAGGAGDFTDLGEAILAAPEEAIIEVAPGLYPIDERAKWIGSTVEVRGAEADTTMVVPDSQPNSQIVLLASESATVSGLRFSAESGSEGVALWIEDAADAIVEDVSMDGFSDRALHLESFGQATVRRSTFSRNDFGITYIYGRHLSLENNLFLDNRVGVWTYYAWTEFDATAGLDIHNNTFSGGEVGLNVCEPGASPVVIQHNIFVGTTSQPMVCGVDLAFSAPTEDWQASGNLL